MKQGGVSRYSVKKFLTQSAENLRREHFCVSLISGAQRKMPMRGISRFSREILLSHSTEKLHRGTFLFYTSFLGSKYFMDRWWGVKELGMSGCSVRKFLSQSTEKLRREHFRNSLISGAQRRMPMRGISRFSKESLLSHSTENFRRGTFLRFTSFWYRENFMDKRGEDGRSITTFYQFFLSHRTGKLCRGTFLFPTKFLASKYFMVKRWGVNEGGVSRYPFKSF